MLIPPVPITLDKPRGLKCNMAALAKLKEWTGYDALEQPQIILGEVVHGDPEDPAKVTGARINATRFNAVLAAFLLHEWPNITPDQAGALIEDLDTLSRAGLAAAEAWLKFAGPKESSDPLRPAASPSGSPSSGQ